MPQTLHGEMVAGPEPTMAARGEALLRAMSDGNARGIGSLVAHDVRMTSFDRGEIHEALGREAVCEQLLRVAERAAGPFVCTGSREAEDALFLWGGSSKSDRPSWMITLFSRFGRVFDVRVYLLR
jgi:hypothetical protein